MNLIRRHARPPGIHDRKIDRRLGTIDEQVCLSQLRGEIGEGVAEPHDLSRQPAPDLRISMPEKDTELIALGAAQLIDLLEPVDLDGTGATKDHECVTGRRIELLHEGQDGRAARPDANGDDVVAGARDRGKGTTGALLCPFPAVRNTGSRVKHIDCRGFDHAGHGINPRRRSCVEAVRTVWAIWDFQLFCVIS